MSNSIDSSPPGQHWQQGWALCGRSVVAPAGSIKWPN
ncbi:MAG: hypothetical protein ACI9JM_001591 [Halioglobus sp.]|jgi:hypothetical protein